MKRSGYLLRIELEIQFRGRIFIDREVKDFTPEDLFFLISKIVKVHKYDCELRQKVPPWFSVKLETDVISPNRLRDELSRKLPRTTTRTVPRIWIKKFVLKSKEEVKRLQDYKTLQDAVS